MEADWQWLSFLWLSVTWYDFQVALASPNGVTLKWTASLFSSILPFCSPDTRCEYGCVSVCVWNDADMLPPHQALGRKISGNLCRVMHVSLSARPQRILAIDVLCAQNNSHRHFDGIVIMTKVMYSQVKWKQRRIDAGYQKSLSNIKS